MSLKKSLWIVLAICTALGLLLIGCPLEPAETSDENTPASKLEKAIVEAEALARQTKVSTDGKDIVKTEKYVTSTQLNAFNQAISAAKDKAGKELTAAEETAAITALKAAQDAFEAAMDAQPGTAIGVSDASALPASGDIIFTGRGTAPAVYSTIGKLTIDTGAQLTTGATSFSSTGNIFIRGGGVFTVRDGTTISGTITVERDGTFNDETTAGSFFPPATVGTITIYSGAVAKSNNSVLFGTSSGNNAGIFQLGDGSIVKVTANDFSLLSGTITLAKSYTLQKTLTIGNGATTATLIIANAAALTGATAGTPKVEVNSGSRIFLPNGSISDPFVSLAPFPTTTNVWTAPASGGGLQISGPATFATWNGSAWAP